MKKILESGGVIWREIHRCLLRSHPQEVYQGTFFQEEARSERVANLVRIGMTSILTVASMLWAFGNESRYAAFDLTVCCAWMILAIVYQAFLMKRAYRPVHKYVSTTIDMLVAMCLMVVYAVAEGPVFVFKTAVFIYPFYALGLAALRFHRNLAVYASVLAVGLLGGIWVWLDVVVGIKYGSRSEHAFGPKLNLHYVTDILIYTGLVGFLIVMVVMAFSRQMELRVAEVERAVREEERAEMAAGLAHEIRNPLMGISGFTQLIREEGLANERFVSAVLNDVNRLNEVVEGYLKFARPFTVRPRMVDLAVLGDGFCRKQTLLFPASPVRFETGKTRQILRTDPDAVEQMLLNLVQNARRHQPSGSPVVIRMEGDCREIRFMVQDDGPGVDPQMVERIYIPFQTSGGAGTGLGLPMVRKIARQLGGDVSYEPREQGGACFTLVLRPVGGGEA